MQGAAPINLILTRTLFLANATSGKMILPTGETLFSIEQPWNNNLKDKSCVPVGLYDLMPYISPKHGYTWYLQNADLGVGGAYEPRSYCELHSANWSEQLEGCIAFGLEGNPSFDPITKQIEPAVENSVDAIRVLINTLGAMSNGNTLTIENA